MAIFRFLYKLCGKKLHACSFLPTRGIAMNLVVRPFDISYLHVPPLLKNRNAVPPLVVSQRHGYLRAASIVVLITCIGSLAACDAGGGNGNGATLSVADA